MNLCLRSLNVDMLVRHTINSLAIVSSVHQSMHSYALFGTHNCDLQLAPILVLCIPKKWIAWVWQMVSSQSTNQAWSDSMPLNFNSIPPIRALSIEHFLHISFDIVSTTLTSQNSIRIRLGYSPHSILQGAGVIFFEIVVCGTALLTMTHQLELVRWRTLWMRRRFLYSRSYLQKVLGAFNIWSWWYLQRRRFCSTVTTPLIHHQFERSPCISIQSVFIHHRQRTCKKKKPCDSCRIRHFYVSRRINVPHIIAV